MEFFFYFLAAATVAAIFYWAVASVDEEDIWSIGIYSGDPLLKLIPHPRTGGQPVLTARDVTDADAVFIADPFLVRADNRWIMFFEVLNAKSNRGEIAYASSDEGINWKYEKLILQEPFHMSYPQVFCRDGVYYMIPETGAANSVRLYKARRFPDDWAFVGELLQGNFLDASIVYDDKRWWLFALENGKHLTLHYADQLTGPWTAHPQNPIITNPACTRPGGRIVRLGSRLLRFSQDGVQTYGHHVTASEIVELTAQTYREREIAEKPIIGATGTGWNAHGMHHIDAHEIASGQWLSAVDGKFIRKRFDWRRGGRAVLSRLGI